MKKYKITKLQVNYKQQVSLRDLSEKQKNFAFFPSKKERNIVLIVPIVPRPMKYGQNGGRYSVADRP